MRFLKRLLIGLALLAAAFATVVALQPADYRLTRQTVIAAPAATIFPHVNDLRQWEDWSPWAKLDPNARVSFEGPPAGVGAMFHWAGNDKVGVGTMMITESKPNERIATRTDFMKPFEGTSNSDFIFSEAGGADQRDLDHERHEQLHRQGALPVHADGEDAGAGFREGAGAVEAGERGEVVNN